MTIIEFNKKYAAYLPKNWYGLDSDNEEYYGEIVK